MRLFYLIKTAVVAFVFATGAAQAVSVHFDVDGAGSSANAYDTTCVIPFTCKSDITASTVGGLGHTTFGLTEGETSHWFDFFTLSVSGFALAQNYEVHAALAFEAPGGVANASGSGVYGTLGFISGGSLNWSDSTIDVAFGNGGLYTVELEEGIAITVGNSATIRARVTLDAAPVPLPASALLLLAGLGGLGAVGARRRMKAAAA